METGETHDSHNQEPLSNGDTLRIPGTDHLLLGVPYATWSTRATGAKVLLNVLDAKGLNDELPSLKLTFSPLKMMVSKFGISFSRGLFSRDMLVSGRVVGGFFPPIWKICSSNWIISPGRGWNKKCLKPPPSECTKFENRSEFQNSKNHRNLYFISVSHLKKSTPDEHRASPQSERPCNSYGHWV